MAESRIEKVEMQVRAEWELDSRAMPAVVNQLMLQPSINDVSGQPQAVYLRLGHMNPPVFQDDGTQENVGQNQIVPVTAVGNFYLPLQTAAALRDLLTRALDDIAEEQA